MKVGILLERSPSWGGTYQYELAVLQCLKDHAENSGHDFIVFGTEFHFEPLDFTAPHISFAELSRQKTSTRLVKLSSYLSRKQSTLPYRIVQKVTNAYRLFLGKSQLPEPHTDALQRAAAAKDIDVMFYPGTFRQCLSLELPYILTVFDVQHRLQPGFPEVSSGGLWEQREDLYVRAIPRAVAIIVDSDAGKDDVIRFYQVPEERVKVLPYLPARSLWAAPAANKTTSVLAKYGIPNGYLFYPAQFWPHKNHVGLLQAVNLLRRRHDIVLPVVLVGADKGNLDYVLGLIAELDLTNQVFYLGFVPDEDLPALYRNAFALVMPTFFGPTNIPVVEAFALECPVITSDIRGMREQVADAGILVDPKSPEQICDGIHGLHQDPSLRLTLIKRGKQQLARWGPKDYAQGLLDVLEEFEPVRRCWRQ